MPGAGLGLRVATFCANNPARSCYQGRPSVNSDDSRGIWTNEGFLVDPHPPSLLDDGSMNCSAFIKFGEGPQDLGGVSLKEAE